ncbi:zinc ribbon domain-containing protein [Streptomyces brasiliensis]|uniref:Cas12f1-like TNB domain-containing protein n=1 Tax=Streptomyces brasiliensis TaxID=1954 RepID=A0A917LB71_9ACTN|nr:zinc ribbon domain-containing protein [Streptomyces brasiliensis]GGJ55276.1 hypothetical protein GCM10010121_077290 [Streptomyces brasiliensis]
MTDVRPDRYGPWCPLPGPKATTPGRLITAIGRECEKTGGRILRASTVTTKLSQTCFCGAKVAKTLADRIHTCTACGLVGDRDMVSAALGAHVRLTDADDPSTARLDDVQARHTQILCDPGLQEALSSHRSAVPAPHGAAPTRQPTGRDTPAAQGLCPTKHTDRYRTNPE